MTLTTVRTFPALGLNLVYILDLIDRDTRGVMDALQKRLQPSQLQLLGRDVFFSLLMVRHRRLQDVLSRNSPVCKNVKQAFAQSDER